MEPQTKYYLKPGKLLEKAMGSKIGRGSYRQTEEGGVGGGLFKGDKQL